MGNRKADLPGRQSHCSPHWVSHKDTAFVFFTKTPFWNQISCKINLSFAISKENWKKLWNAYFGGNGFASSGKCLLGVSLVSARTKENWISDHHTGNNTLLTSDLNIYKQLLHKWTKTRTNGQRTKRNWIFGHTLLTCALNISNALNLWFLCVFKTHTRYFISEYCTLNISLLIEASFG